MFVFNKFLPYQFVCTFVNWALVVILARLCSTYWTCTVLAWSSTRCDSMLVNKIPERKNKLRCIVFITYKLS